MQIQIVNSYQKTLTTVSSAVYISLENLIILINIFNYLTFTFN